MKTMVLQPPHPDLVSRCFHGPLLSWLLLPTVAFWPLTSLQSGLPEKWVPHPHPTHAFKKVTTHLLPIQKERKRAQSPPPPHPPVFSVLPYLLVHRWTPGLASTCRRPFVTAGPGLPLQSPVPRPLTCSAPTMLATLHFFEICKQFQGLCPCYPLCLGWLLLKQPLHSHASVMSQELTPTKKPSSLTYDKPAPLSCPVSS